MEIKLYNSSPSYLEIKFSYDFEFLILPKFYRPEFHNIKKQKGDKWTSRYLRWFLEFGMNWLIFRFVLKIAKK